MRVDVDGKCRIWQEQTLPQQLVADIAKTVDTSPGLQGLHDVQPSAGMKRVLVVVVCLGIDANCARGVCFCWRQMMMMVL